jgi:hypothetical protein
MAADALSTDFDSLIFLHFSFPSQLQSSICTSADGESCYHGAGITFGSSSDSFPTTLRVPNLIQYKIIFQPQAVAAPLLLTHAVP